MALQWERKPSPILEAVRDAVCIKVWGQAAKHHNGKGVEGGIDLQIVLALYKGMIKSGDHRQAGTLLNAVSGGIWTQSRKADAGMPVDPTCPHCGLERQDDWHFVWGCPCLETSPDARIQKSNWLKGEAWRYKDTMPCLYLRGLTPKASTHRNLDAVETVASLPREVDGHHPSQAIFLDGSGGRCPGTLGSDAVAGPGSSAKSTPLPTPSGSSQGSMVLSLGSKRCPGRRCGLYIVPSSSWRPVPGMRRNRSTLSFGRIRQLS